MLALALGLVLGRQLAAKPAYADRLEPNAVVGMMPGKTEEQIREELDRQVADNIIAFAINSRPVFENGTAEGNLLFENPTSNGKLTRLELYRDDTGELLYSTGLLEPGSYVPAAKLELELPAGEYACTAYIYAYRLADESYVGKVSAGLELTVQA